MDKTETVDLTEIDRDLLRSMAGEHVPGLMWGAAMSESVEFLYGNGLISRSMAGGALTYEITASGRAALARAKP